MMIAALVAAASVAVPALASHYEASLEGSQFEIDDDANLVVDSPSGFDDWASVNEVRTEDQPTGQGDDSFKGGVKEDTVCPQTTTGSIPNNKSDLKWFGVYEEPGTGAHPGFLHIFWSRVQEPAGTTLMDFEFNQSDVDCGTGFPVRTVGDLLIEYSIDQGGARATLTLREWAGTAWGPASDLTATGDATGTINSTPIDAAHADGLGAHSARTFGEASIDLSVIFDEGSCESFGSAHLKSRSSDAFTSQLKDFIAPTPIDITNCGAVRIRKQTDPDEDPATTTFGYTKTFPTDPATANTFTLTDDGVASFNNVLFGSDYTVTEDVIPAGWEFTAIDCAVPEHPSVGVTPVIVGATITFSIDDEADILDCTYYNRARGTIVVEKITDDGFGSFEFTSGTLSPSPFTLTTTAAGDAGKDSRTFADLAPGTYDVAETVPAGWRLVSATCDDGSDPASIALAGGETVTCTFHDARDTGAINIVKTRKHAADGPGDHPHEGVTFTITGGELPAAGVTVVTDANGQACYDGLVVSALAGDYTVTETVPSGYVTDKTSDTATVATSTCAAGDGVTVSFGNTPLTDLTVSVDSQVDGGTASTIDCVLAAGATGPSGDGSLTLSDLEPGTYTCTVVIDP